MTLIACLIGGLAALLLAALIPPGSIPFEVSTGRILGSAAFLLVAAFIGCAFSFRRVLRVDPATALQVAAVATLCGVLAAVVPARRAAALDPAQAIRL